MADPVDDGKHVEPTEAVEHLVCTLQSQAVLSITQQQAERCTGSNAGFLTYERVRVFHVVVRDQLAHGRVSNG